MASGMRGHRRKKEKREQPSSHDRRARKTTGLARLDDGRLRSGMAQHLAKEGQRASDQDSPSDRSVHEVSMTARPSRYHEPRGHYQKEKDPALAGTTN